MHDSDRYLGEILQKIGVCLAFLIRNFEVQFLVLLKQVGKTAPNTAMRATMISLYLVTEGN